MSDGGSLLHLSDAARSTPIQTMMGGGDGGSLLDLSNAASRVPIDPQRGGDNNNVTLTNQQNNTNLSKDGANFLKKINTTLFNNTITSKTKNAETKNAGNNNSIITEANDTWPSTKNLVNPSNTSSTPITASSETKNAGNNNSIITEANDTWPPTETLATIQQTAPVTSETVTSETASITTATTQPKFTDEQLKTLKQYGLDENGVLANNPDITDEIKEKFLEEINSGKCSTNIGDSILSSNCQATVKVIRALVNHHIEINKTRVSIKKDLDTQETILDVTIIHDDGTKPVISPSYASGTSVATLEKKGIINTMKNKYSKLKNYLSSPNSQSKHSSAEPPPYAKKGLLNNIKSTAKHLANSLKQKGGKRKTSKLRKYAKKTRKNRR
jgi:hypothetical protein